MTNIKPRMSAGTKTYNGLIRFLYVLGILSILYYFSWWFVDNRLQSPFLTLLFVVAAAYSGTQFLGNWTLYLMARPQLVSPTLSENLTVDVFVTSYREPYPLIEQALAAACAMRGEHKTWLLDDGSDPALAALAKRLGAGYLTRSEHRDAKAGNLNAALPRTSGDIIVIFDIDHVPAPNFLEKSLGYFSDPKVGFVQVMLTFANGIESWVAQAAFETSLEFYNPTSLGAAGVGGATLMGSNALIRRKALESIGGYQPGLAEDLATSLALHGAGWHSAYLARPLAPGLAPPNFTAWFVQQLKWARGVFELLLTSYPRLFFRLTWGQRLSYAVRMTKYWIGPVVGLHLFATIAILIFGNAPMQTAFHQYLIHIAPLAVCDVLIRYFALRKWRHPATPRTSLFRAVALVYATWPIYLLAWSMAVLRLPLKFRPTPKSNDGRLNPVWLLPQVTALLLLVAGTLYTILVGHHRPSLLLLFAIVQGAFQLILLYQWLDAENKIREGIPISRWMALGFAQPKGSTRWELSTYLHKFDASLRYTFDQVPKKRLNQVVAILHEARLSHKRVFILGNNSSVPAASQLAGDLSKIRDSRPCFRVYLLVDNPLLSFLNSASGSEDLFVRQLAGFIQPQDVVIAISTLGNAPEMIRAMQFANQLGATTVGFTSLNSGRLGALVDVNLYVPSSSIDHVDDVHLLISRLICKALVEMPQQQVNENKMADLPLEKELDTRSVALLAGDGSRSAIDLLYEIGQMDDLHALFQKVLELSLQSLGAASGSILSLDDNQEIQEAYLAYAGKMRQEPPLELAGTLQDGLAGWVICNRKPALINNTLEDPRWMQRAWEDECSSRSVLSVPLIASGRVLGVLTLAHTQPGYFTESDLVTLAAIGLGLSEKMNSLLASPLQPVNNTLRREMVK